MTDPAPTSGSGAGAGEPGWYPAEEGFVRWWDGTTWGPPRPAGGTEATGGASRAEDGTGERSRTPLPHARPGDNTRTVAVLAHLGFVFGWFIMPLAVYRIERDHPYLRHHAAEALNFQILVTLAVLVSIPLMAVGVGFVTLLVALAADVVLGVVAAVRAARGVWWRYPVNLRLVRP